MDYVYTRFLRGLQLDNIQAHELLDYESILSSLAKNYRPSCILACHLPKSASTYLYAILTELTQFPYENLAWGYDHNEQNLDLSRLIKTSGHAHMGKLVMTAGDNNCFLMRAFNIKPIILTRSIFDVIVSLRDHFQQESPVWPQIYANKYFTSLNESDKLDQIIDHFIPWCINFLNSWLEAESKLGYAPLWLTYNDITQDLTNSCKKILDYYELSADLNQIESVKEKHKTPINRYNKGVSGRGQETLTEKQQERIRSFFRLHPHLTHYL